MHYLSKYQVFSDVSELNHHVKQHTNRKKYDMNETQRNLLQFISQYSVKYPGASHLKTQTIADGIGKSRRTVERAVKALVALEVIEKLSTTRAVRGGKGANIYRILPYVVESEMSHGEKSKKASPAKENEPIVKKQTEDFISEQHYVLEPWGIPAPLFANILKVPVVGVEPTLPKRREDVLFLIYLKTTHLLANVDISMFVSVFIL
ncbi:hypothetical protein J32TS6_25840 [Virgibacillus pantothenticus]|uniref:hypothetical protein n=1 Tax=Virgibacillus pantothenticus TaxID=1473 RepID=UPI001B08B23E|nr:hypothetical protein [Virgibacillus pantothenticus]GIP64029.1 hypothetical protein J32TS6_25840 [Virgibacillus pantothenticus]